MDSSSLHHADSVHVYSASEETVARATCISRERSTQTCTLRTTERQHVVTPPRHTCTWIHECKRVAMVEGGAQKLQR